MKKFTAFILSAALVLSMAGCTDSSNNSTGSNIPVASQKVNSHKDPDSSLIPGKDILTPATTEAQEFIKTQYSNYTYYSTAEEYDRSKGRSLDNMDGERFFGGQIFIILCTPATGLKERTPYSLEVNFIEKSENLY